MLVRGTAGEGVGVISRGATRAVKLHRVSLRTARSRHNEWHEDAADGFGGGAKCVALGAGLAQVDSPFNKCIAQAENSIKAVAAACRAHEAAVCA